MGYQINISKEAERDLQTAKCFYRLSGIEEKYDADFVNQITYLKTSPYLFQVYYRNVRRLHFHDFNYSIHYLVQDQAVYILRILHNKQYMNEGN
ncbi:type II toxin-antitoxin system RelE/ParE family toxin [Flagellimonas sp.]|uniref:type II toxin-antitoxin system RelE/ParE family toxin n=1 Tax=Flagellimonas sp. TaxID=2058762 RepID=UPI003B502177